MRVVVCRGPECGERLGSATIARAFTDACQRQGAVGIQMEWQSCFGRCSQGINVLVQAVPNPSSQPAQPRFLLATLPGGKGARALYQRLTVEKVEQIVARHLIGGAIVREYTEAAPPVILPPIPSFLAGDGAAPQTSPSPAHDDGGGATMEDESAPAKRKSP